MQEGSGTAPPRRRNAHEIGCGAWPRARGLLARARGRLRRDEPRHRAAPRHHGGNRPQRVAVAAARLEAAAERRAREPVAQRVDDLAGDHDAAAGAQRQRDMPREVAQQPAEHRQRPRTIRVARRARMREQLLQSDAARPLAAQLADRAIHLLHAVAAQHLFDGQLAVASRERVQHGGLVGLVRGQRRLARRALQQQPAAAQRRRHEAAHVQRRAGRDPRDGAATVVAVAAHRPGGSVSQQRQRPRAARCDGPGGHRRLRPRVHGLAHRTASRRARAPAAAPACRRSARRRRAASSSR